MKNSSMRKIKDRKRRKLNPELVETIQEAIKNPEWKEIAHLLAAPSRKQTSLNLFEIEKNSKAGDTIIVPGKVLSKGELKKKVRICALSISESAREKLKESKSEFVTIHEEIKKNKKAEGLKVLR